jgi:hypothetical protein
MNSGAENCTTRGALHLVVRRDRTKSNSRAIFYFTINVSGIVDVAELEVAVTVRV